MITDFFTTISDLRAFAPQMPTDGRIETMEAHYRPQYQKIVNLIGISTYDKLKTQYLTSGTDLTTTLGQAVNYLRGALANLTAIPYFKFEASQRNNTDNNLYRYQETQQIEIYLENAWTELNFLLDIMEQNTKDFPDYASTPQYKLRDSLFIKNASEFKRYYGAVNSSYFFNNVIFIIEEIQNDEIKSRVKSLSDITDENLKWLIGKAIAYETLSRACLQLDYTELPVGIRNDLAKEVNEKNGKETEVKSALSAAFGNKADEYFLKIEETNSSSVTEDCKQNIGPVDPLHQEDKFYMP